MKTTSFLITNSLISALNTMNCLVKTGISAEDAVEWIEADDFELLNSIAFIIAKKDDTNISGI